jgi:hypothetical protein
MTTKRLSGSQLTPSSQKNKSRPKSSNKAPKSVARPSLAPEPEPYDLDEDSAVDPDNALMFKDDPALDRRIIEGMLRDRKALVEEMAKEGWTSAAVMRRAADLGFSEAFIRQVQGVAADLAGERPGARKTPSALGARTCLSCDRVFLSSGPGNRLCMRCRGGDAGLAQL